MKAWMDDTWQRINNDKMCNIQVCLYTYYIYIYIYIYNVLLQVLRVTQTAITHRPAGEMAWTCARHVSEPPWTHQGRVTHIRVSKLHHHWFRWWSAACSVLLSESVLSYCQLEQTSFKIISTFKCFLSEKCIWKCRLKNGGHFFLGHHVL